MHSLTEIHFDETNSVDILKKIIGRKHKTKKDGSANEEKKQLEDGEKIIRESYHSYYTRKADLYNLRPDAKVGKELKQALINTYQENPAPIVKLRRAYREKQIWCPYCSVGVIKQLDHYMPKEKYPEFALLDFNLVPSCADCNGIKHDGWNEHQYVLFNPFLHQLPDIQILKAELDMSGSKDGVPGIRFYIDETAGADPNTVSLVKSHCNTLGLTAQGNGIYVIKAVEHLSDTLRDLKKTYERTRTRKDEKEAWEFIFNILEDQVKSRREQYGINHWKTAALGALLDNKTALPAVFSAIK